MTDQGSIDAFVSSLGDAAVDLLICNSGVYLDKGHVLETGFDTALWSQTFAVNVTGVFLTIKALLPHLRRAQNAKIAIISSVMASQTKARGGAYIYSSSKAAVLNLGRNMAADLHAQGIAMGIYHPGWVITDMGGQNASITVDQSVEGLMQRIAALSLKTSGSFEGYDGEAIPF